MASQLSHVLTGQEATAKVTETAMEMVKAPAKGIVKAGPWVKAPATAKDRRRVAQFAEPADCVASARSREYVGVRAAPDTGDVVCHRDSEAILRALRFWVLSHSELSQ
jgi:hypothetical protein